MTNIDLAQVLTRSIHFVYLFLVTTDQAKNYTPNFFCHELKDDALM